jgi:hypothetical protein
MRGKARPLGLLALTTAFLILCFGASGARAEFGIEKWEVLTCKENIDLPAPGGEVVGEPPLEPSPKPCTAATPSQWFTQATGHPPFGITDLTLNTLTGIGKEGFPDGFVKDIIVDTPEGLGVNPEATPKCSLAVAEVNVLGCPPTSLVGLNYLTVAIEAPGPGCVPKCEQKRVAVPVYNIEPFQGHPSMVAFPSTTGTVFIVGSLNPADQHVIFTISDLESPLEGGAPLVRSRLVFFGTAGDGTYLTMPSNCAGGQTASVRVTSHEGGEDSASFTTAVGADECESAPFNVQLDATSSGATDSPEPATVDVQMPDQLQPGVRANSHLLTAKVTLPNGAGLNPSVANGLSPCTDAQFKRGTDDAIECPASSRIGSVEVETRALDQPLGGDVYVAEPTSQDPSSGNQFRVFIHVFNARYGVNVRLIGHVFPNLQTGQLTVVVPENPQAPFNSFKVHINGGARGALTTPDTCGPHTTTARFVPWSRPGEEVPPSSGDPQFSLQTLPGGGPCPKKLGERPFGPAFDAASNSPKAGKYSPFRLRITRSNGNQEIRQVNVDLPPGMVAKLKGVAYCSEADIAGAARHPGKAETTNPSCPSNSQVGTLDVDVGSGQVFRTSGKAYLAGPYKDAPISLVFIVPAVAGPYDLGTVVIRTALNVNPETAEVHAVSDPIPYIFGGVKLDVRSIYVSIDRKGFTVNPTTCREQFQIASGIFGGGENPANPASWFEAKSSAGFRANECRKLKFKPEFHARILGGKNHTKRTKNPKFQAIFDARGGDANLRRAAFILPRATILDQSHIRTICTRVKLAANECPKNSIYGHAKATSPLLAKALKGPVYLTSSSHELPDLLVDLHGQVPIRLRGVISSAHGRLKTVFNNTPDVAVNKFILTMKGDRKGLLVNSRDLCSRPTTGFLSLKAQNSRRLKRNNLRLNIPACQGGKKRNG